MTRLLQHGLAVYGYMTIPLLWLLKPYGYAMVWLYMTIGLYGLVAMPWYGCTRLYIYKTSWLERYKAMACYYVYGFMAICK